MIKKIFLSTVLLGIFLFGSNICAMNIFEAIENGNEKRVLQLIKKDKNLVNQANNNKETSLY